MTSLFIVDPETGEFEPDTAWDNSDAIIGNSNFALNFFLIFVWSAYLTFCYFTLINYSYFISAKSWADYSNFTLN